MSAPRVPWWYSGDEEIAPGPDDMPPKQGEGYGLPAVDWTALTAGAQRLVDWATERVMAPHAEHDDPRDHAQCVVCRAMLLIGDRPTGPSDTAPQPTQPPVEIAWIPIVGESDEP